jgi:NADPH:quinone reductase-like Zn-dependent oxidoreductase
MRAVQIATFGGPEVVHVAEVKKPSPAADEVLVKVGAAGINPVDWKIREGYLRDVLPLPLPITLGNEIAGTVVEVGAQVRDRSIGDRVHGGVGMIGGLAEFVTVKAANLAKLPGSMSMVEAAAIPTAAATAIPVLDAAGVGAGTTVLVHAAAGAVGSMLIQLAKLRGAYVIALTSAANIEYIRSLGADKVLDRTGNWQASVGTVDAVLDAFGLPAQESSWGVIKRGGILVSIAHPPSEQSAAAHGVRGTMVFGHPNGPGLAQVDALIEAKKVKVRIAGTFPLENVREALAASQSGSTVGKLVLTFG